MPDPPTTGGSSPTRPQHRGCMRVERVRRERSGPFRPQPHGIAHVSAELDFAWLRRSRELGTATSLGPGAPTRGPGGLAGSRHPRENPRSVCREAGKILRSWTDAASIRAMGRRLSLRWYLIGVLAATACGDTERPPVIPGAPDGSVRNDGGTDSGRGDGGGDAGEEICVDPSGPSVEITEPAPARDPNTDTVLTSELVVVKCRATRATTPDSRPVDTDSVAIVRLDENGEVVDSPAVTTDGSEFRASFQVRSVPNGVLRFRCTASDTHDTPRCGRSDLETLLDLGPTIEVLTPNDGSIHSDRMNLSYRITEAPLDETDTESTLAGHTLTVAGKSIGFMTEEMPGRFQVSIDFTDRTVFEEPVAGAYELVITATNTRTPSAPVRRVVRSFTVDSTGPSITVNTPTDGALVGGRVRVEATITDPAGIDPSKVELRIGQERWTMIAGANDRYAVTFDASVYPSTTAELTLNITAEDIVGNAHTVARIVKLDSRPPIASLDPPFIREGVRQNNVLRCSTLFDPVGDDAVNDGEIVGTGARFRARVQDLGNGGITSGNAITFLAGVATTGSTKLYLLDDVNGALLVDTNDDGICDAINPAVEPVAGNASPAVVVDLVGITPTGTAFFSSSGDPTVPGSPAEAYGSVFADCNTGTTANPPNLLCSGYASMTRVIPATVSGRPPGIFGKPPITGLTCAGDSFDFQQSIAEGWACVAVRTEDRLGNVGVSAPLRVCFTDGMGPNPCPGALGSIVDPSTLPSCTSGCTPPPGFEVRPGLQLVIPVQ